MVKNKNSHSSKAKGFKDEEKRIAHEIFSVMPELPELFVRLADRVERFDVRQPKTFIADTKGEFGAFVAKLQGRERHVERMLRYLMGNFAFKALAKRMMAELIAITKSEASLDPHCSLLMKLMHEADEAVPLVSIIVPLRHADPESALPPQCAPVEFLRQAEREKGEIRATATLHALAATAEFLYKPYLITIWYLSYFKEQKIPPTQVPDFGELVKQAHSRLGAFPSLVELDAKWMRNSAVHHLPNYIQEEDSLWMEAKNVPAQKVRVDDLLVMVKRMYLMSAVTIHRAGQLYMFRDLFVNTGLFDMFIKNVPILYSGDEKRIASVEYEMMEYARALIEPLEKFFNSQS